MLNKFRSIPHAYAVLRLSVVMCFIGHGVFGIITKQIWCNYFALFGIGHTLAYRLMPVVGLFDLMMGLAVLCYPMRIFFVWLVIWGALTALLRPLAGEPLAEMLERAGNFGAPLALLLLDKSSRPKFYLRKIEVSKVAGNLERATFCLKIAAFSLLAGHGWLNLLGKEAWVARYHEVGGMNGYQVAIVLGCIELAGALGILIGWFRALPLLFLFWKMVTEALYPHYTIVEWIERGGSYGVLLALWYLQSSSLRIQIKYRLSA
jgi:hypothetical protein